MEYYCNTKSKNKWQSQKVSKKFKKRHGQTTKLSNDEIKTDHITRNDNCNKLALNQFTDSDINYSWIIIGGKYSKRAHAGIPKDISRLQSFASNKKNANHRLSSILKQATASTINAAISQILTEFTEIDASQSKQLNHCIMIAFSGHGDKNGDWYLYENTAFSLSSILDSIAMYQDNYKGNNTVNLMILSNACCSGNWCYDLEKIKKKKNNFKYDISYINDIGIIAASERNEWEYEIQRNPNDGGRFFKFLVGIGGYENHSGLNMCYQCKSVKNKKYKYREHKQYHDNQYCFVFRDYRIVVHQNGCNQLYQWDDKQNQFEIQSSYHVNDNKKHKNGSKKRNNFKFI